MEKKIPGINVTPKRGFKNMPESAIKRFFEVNTRFYHGGKIESPCKFIQGYLFK